MDFERATVFVTGANRGLGAALVDAFLERGVSKIYAAARRIEAAQRVAESNTKCVIPVELNLTDSQQVSRAARLADDTTLLVNNASTALFSNALDATVDSLAIEMNTNYLGTLELTRAFVPVIEAGTGGRIVNVLSLVSLASDPNMAGYSASKAAMHSATQSLRPVLAARGIAVQGVYPGGIETEMLDGWDLPKAAPDAVARKIVSGIETGADYIFPDPESQAMSSIWWRDPKSFEEQFAVA